MNSQTLGLLAGVLTTTAWLPQITRTWRSRSADDLSWPYLLVFSAGVTLWLVYGVLSADVPLLVANGVTMLLVSLLLVLKCHSAAIGSTPRQRAWTNDRQRSHSDASSNMRSGAPDRPLTKRA
jgi:MtN3 and saliva related transmembrane protein